MATPQTQSNLVVAYSPVFKTQSATDVPVANADLTAAMPIATLPTFREVEKEERDCLRRIYDYSVDTRLAEWTFDFTTVTPSFIYGWLAMLKGVSAAPTGTTANETQTLALGGATSGTYKLRFQFEGLDSTTDVIAFDASNATIQAALTDQKMRSIVPGDVVVTGTTAKTLTFGGRLASANIPLLTVVSDTTAGGTAVTVTAGADGSQKLHVATDATTDALKLTSLIYGFKGDSTPPAKLINLAVNTIALTIPRRSDNVTMRLGLIGSFLEYDQIGFTLPSCTNVVPLKPDKCRVKINNTFYADLFNNATYSAANNVITDAEAYAFDSPDLSEFLREDDGGSLRESYTFQFKGSKGDALWSLGKTRTFAPTSLLLGAPGDRCEITSPNNKLTLASPDTTFSPRNKTLLNLIGRPMPDASIADARTIVRGYLSQSATFLASS